MSSNTTRQRHREENEDQYSTRSSNSSRSGSCSSSSNFDDVLGSDGMICNDDGPRFLMDGTGFQCYDHLVHHISKMAKFYDCNLPNEIITNVAGFFTIKPLDPDRTRALTCSSTSGQYSLDHCLIDSESSWWISSTGAFRNGKGEEYVEFELGSTMVRLSAVFISIPPMPRGPLSVRTLRLDSIAGGEWRAVTPILVVENRSGWQRLDLPKPVDVQRVRVVCLSNQASRVLDRTTTAPPEFDLSYGAVGFYSIKFA